jgi:hypothetical protein
MSISAPPGAPSIGETLSSSFRDAYSVAKTNLVPAAIFIAAGSIAAYLMVPSIAVFEASAGAGKAAAQPVMPPAFTISMGLIDVLIFIVSCYAMAAAVRTIHPEYRMTAGQFFGIIGYSLLASLLTLLACVCFIIPGYWVGIKVLMTPYTYAVTGGTPGALKTTWNMTTGYYWQTFGMLLAAGFCLGVLIDGAVFACVAGASELPPSLYVLAPLATAVLVWAMHVQALVYVRWVNGLLPRANMPQAVPVPA